MQQLYKNAATIPSSVGRGAHGHIGLVMEPALYSSLFATAYNAPNAPTRTTYPGNVSSRIRYNEDNHYRKELDTYENHIAMDNVMKNKRCSQPSYGLVQANQASQPSDKWRELQQPMDISQPIDAYFAQINDCIQYVSDGKTPYTSKQILTTFLHAMQKTG
eukprot:11580381-Ditylum_brightwellii.AAC.1